MVWASIQPKQLPRSYVRTAILVYTLAGRWPGPVGWLAFQQRIRWVVADL